MTTASQYSTQADMLRDDEAVLRRVWIAHKTRTSRGVARLRGAAGA